MNMILKKPETWNIEEWTEVNIKIKMLSIRKTFHFKAYDMCNKFDTYINLPIIILTSLVSTMAISQTSEQKDEESHNYKNYIISSISLFVTLLSSVGKYFNYAEAKESHRQAALNYLRLRCDLANKLAHSRREGGENKISFEDFMEFYYSKFVSIRENTLALPEKIRIEMDKKSDDDKKSLKKKINTLNNNNETVVLEIPDEETIDGDNGESHEETEA